jgi:hypothetical protein
MARTGSSRDHFPLLFVAGIALLGFVSASLIRAAGRGSFADALSTYRSDRRGARALFLLASESGLPVSRLQKSLEVIDPGSQLVLLAIDGAPEPEPADLESLFGGLDGGTPSPDAGTAPSDGEDREDRDARTEREGLNRLFVTGVGKEERESLLKHLDQGHTLLYAPWSAGGGDELLAALNVGLEDTGGVEAVGLVPAVPSPLTAGVERVEVPVRSYFELPDGALPLLVTDTEERLVAMALVPHGAGRVILLGAPELAANEWLGRADNAQLWLSTLGALAARGPVQFDEFHHGFTSQRSVAEFASRYGLHFAIGQLLIGLCLWAGALRRFGRPRAPPADERLAGTDALSATSRIYREGKHFAHAAQQILRGLLQDLAPLAGRRMQDGVGPVAIGLRQRGRPDLAAALADVSRSADAATSDRDVERTARAAALARRRMR